MATLYEEMLNFIQADEKTFYLVLAANLLINTY